MKLVRITATLLAAGMVASACDSAEPIGLESETDSGLPPSDAGASDGEAPDAVAADVRTVHEAGTAKPLDVECEDQALCYVSVSGNGGQHLCGLLADGTVRCWGRDAAPVVLDDGGIVSAAGALGRGEPASEIEGATPAPVVGLSDVTQISVGPNLGTCARTSDGSVYCWGKNEHGQLGRPPSEVSLLVPTRVEGIPPVDEVRLGFSVGCAIATADRALYCWGYRRNFLDSLPVMDALGIDAGVRDARTFAPQRATNFPPPVKELAVGSWTTERQTVIALLDEGILATVGDRPLGLSSLPPPWPTPGEVQGVARIWEFAYLASDGSLHQWLDGEGPLYVPSLDPVVDVKISGDGFWSSHRMFAPQYGVLHSTGRLFRWGPNTSGALGVEPDTLAYAVFPLEMTELAGQVVSFATTLSEDAPPAAATCASLVNGKVKCWGDNTFGELGRGTVDTAPHPEMELIR